MKMNRKRSICLIVLLVLILSGCSQSAESINETQTDTEMSLMFRDFSGSREKNIVVEENQPRIVSVALTCTSGEMNLYIVNSETGEKAFTGQKLSTDSFTVTLKEAGSYLLTFDAKSAEGSLAVNIAEEKQ